MAHPVKSPRKLIEVALPLDAINSDYSRDVVVAYHRSWSMGQG